MLKLVKKLVRNAIRDRGYEIVKQPNPHTFLAARNVDLVIDVGAWEGEHGDYLRRWGYKRQILSLEPTRKAYAALARATEADPLWEILNLAAGDQPGVAAIHVSKDDGYSSFCSVSLEGQSYDPLIAVDHTEDVQVVTIDSLMEHRTATRPFLKIDTQGFERQVLDGSRTFLDRCVGLQLELPVAQLYDGVWSLVEALGYLEERGFVPAQVWQVNAYPNDHASAAEFDVILRRRVESGAGLAIESRAAA